MVQVLEKAMDWGIVKMENVSGDGSKIHANASKSKAMSYKRIVERKKLLEKEVEELMGLGEEEISAGMNRGDEIELRNLKISRLCEAEKVLEQRAEERYKDELAAHKERMAERAAEEKATGKKIGGPKPKKPTRTGPEDKAQYNFTDPESRIMPEGNHDGYEQSYNAQAAVEQESMLIVGACLSDNPNDKRLAMPLLDAIPSEIGQPKNVAYDTGYWSEKNVAWLKLRLVGLRHTLRQNVNPITCLGKNDFYHRQSLLLRMHQPRSRWLISSKRVRAKRFIDDANLRLNPYLALSRR